MKEQFRAEQGFTLVEILVAVIILSVIIVAFMPMFTNSVANIYTAGNRSEARFQVQEVIERVLGDINEEPVYSSADVEDFELYFADRNVPIEVPARAIEVEVDYTTARGEPRSVNVWTLVLE